MKLTKREYTKQMNDLTSRKNTVANYVQKIIDNIETLDRPLTEDEVTKINRLHDKVYSLQQAIEALDFAWQTRSYNSADWITHSLIAQNID